MTIDFKKKTILASYIKNIFLNSISIQDIINLLNSDNLEKSIIDIYFKYKSLLNDVSEKEFASKIIDISTIINNMSISEFNDNYDTREKLLEIINRKEQYNFEKITYSMYLFTKKLYFNLLKNNAKKVYFFSREGQFLKKIFDSFQDSIIGPKIKTEYLCVSRASTFLGTLKTIRNEKFINLFRQYPNMSLETFCKNLTFSENEIKKLSSNMGVNFNEEINDIINSASFKKMCSNKDFIALYDDKRKNAKKSFIKYLSEFGNDYKQELFVVDVGWKGTIQDNIQKILPNTIIKGFYLGLVNYENIEDYDKKMAILFEKSPFHETNNNNLYNSNRSIFEILLAANHGSVINYEETKKGIKVVYNNQEAEKKLYVEKILPIQNNIFKKFCEIINVLKYFDIDDEYVEKIFNKKHFELLYKPSKSELKEYNEFYHYENFGVMNYSYFNKKNNISYLQKLKNYYHFKTYIQYDDTWQYLKLYNDNMYLGKLILYLYKKYKYQKNNII